MNLYNDLYSNFDGVTATVYYPEGDSSWTGENMLDYGGSLTWVPYDTPPVFDQPIPGDVNGDGVVSTSDILLLRQYLAHYDDDTQTSVIVISAGADLNSDGTVNGKDLILLRKQTAN